MTQQIVTFTERPDLGDVDNVMDTGGPPFMQNDLYSNQYWSKLKTRFPDFQFVLLEDDRPIAIGNSIPVRWDGSDASLPDGGWDAMLVSGMMDYEDGIKPDTLCALGITITPTHLGKGISRGLLLTMREIAAKHQLKALIAPVRPTQKAQYPLIPMDEYITWKRDDGLLFDPWLRTHAHLEARLVKSAPQSMFITGTIEDWQHWTNMAFPGSGQYIIPGALVPVSVDVENDTATYTEPNVWMVHPVANH
jgi:hypothetical protein